MMLVIRVLVTGSFMLFDPRCFSRFGETLIAFELVSESVSSLTIDNDDMVDNRCDLIICLDTSLQTLVF